MAMAGGCDDFDVADPVHADTDVRKLARASTRRPRDVDVVRSRRGMGATTTGGASSYSTRTIPAGASDGISFIRRHGGRRNPRQLLPLTTLLLFVRANRVSSFVSAKCRCAGTSSTTYVPLLDESAGCAGGTARTKNTIRFHGFGPDDLDDDASADIVEDGGLATTRDIISRSRYHRDGNRRSFLSSLPLASSLLGANPAYAARGAAEYDLEYYVRDLL